MYVYVLYDSHGDRLGLALTYTKARYSVTYKKQIGGKTCNILTEEQIHAGTPIYWNPAEELPIGVYHMGSKNSMWYIGMKLVDAFPPTQLSLFDI